VEAVNPPEPPGRYFKLNLLSLIDGSRQHTIDLRQQGIDLISVKDLMNWIRLINRLVDNALNCQRAINLKDNSSLNRKLDCLFEYGVKDAALRSYFLERARDQ
jgi:hypothetical protein